FVVRGKTIRGSLAIFSYHMFKNDTPKELVETAAALELFNVDLALHSQGELGISMAAQLHLAATLPGLTHAADAHYHHLTDDIIEGGKLPHEQGGMRVPTGPGLGITLDRHKLMKYHELAREMQTAAQTSMVGDPNAAEHLPILPRW
ncbi:MAG: hypothetical protein HYR94_06505, partial [Chloroflexi bacterium]|nr:hypothetical protein [Chloroflexota bacterium]